MDNIEAMEEARTKAEAHHHVADRAKAYSDSVLPFFVAIRTAADALEGLVGDEYWQLPKYREMLFVK
jgi:glutamine synthetase